MNLYRGFLAILNKDEPHLSAVERYVEVASVLCMREWRRLPPIVSHIHLPILQAAQQIMELQEVCDFDIIFFLNSRTHFLTELGMSNSSRTHTKSNFNSRYEGDSQNLA